MLNGVGRSPLSVARVGLLGVGPVVVKQKRKKAKYRQLDYIVVLINSSFNTGV